MTALATPCDRCGTFAALTPAWERELCAECLDRRHFAEREPLTTGYLLSGAWRIVGALSPAVLGLALLCGAAREQLSAAVGGSVTPRGLWIGGFVDLCLAALTTDMFDAFVVLACLAAIEGSMDQPFRRAWPIVLRVWPRLALFNLIASIAGLLGVMLLVAPLFIAGTLWVLALPILLVEQRSIPSALELGVARARRGFGSVLGAAFLLGLVPLAIGVAQTLLFPASRTDLLARACRHGLSALSRVGSLPLAGLAAVTYVKLAVGKSR